MKELLVKLKPTFDEKAWNEAKAKMQASGARISSLIGSSGESLTDSAAMQSLANFAKKGLSELTNFSPALSAFATGISAATGILITAYKKALEVAEEGADLSNKFVSSSSMFVDSSVKSTMARFGVSSETAQAYNKTFETMGISASDLATLTSGQREAFDELVEHYQSGLAKLDADKLDEYNQRMQEFQMLQAKFTMDMELAVMNLFVNSEKFPELLDTIEEVMAKLVELLSSETAQFAFNTFLAFVESLLDVFNFVGDIFGLDGAGSVTNNTNNSSNNVQQSFTIYASNSNDLENSVTDLAYKLNDAYGG